MDFKQYVILTEEHSVLTKIISSFESENIQTHYNALSYMTDLYFHDYKLAIEIYENEHRDRNIDYEVKKQKTIEEELIL